MAKHRTDSSTIHTGKRVKVAILDTGYDRSNQDLKDVATSLPSGIGWQDFVGNEKKPVDKSGHGSRVAYFLLQMTTNIDLWIARVYEKDEGIPESATSVKYVSFKVSESTFADNQRLSTQPKVSGRISFACPLASRNGLTPSRNQSRKQTHKVSLSLLLHQMTEGLKRTTPPFQLT
jgi:hypothetical protein